MVIEKWNNNEAFEKWNNNEAFEKWNNNRGVAVVERLTRRLGDREVRGSNLRAARKFFVEWLAHSEIDGWMRARDVARARA